MMGAVTGILGGIRYLGADVLFVDISTEDLSGIFVIHISSFFLYPFMPVRKYKKSFPSPVITY